jgi:hypothetical protein
MGAAPVVAPATMKGDISSMKDIFENANNEGVESELPWVDNNSIFHDSIEDNERRTRLMKSVSALERAMRQYALEALDFIENYSDNMGMLAELSSVNIRVFEEARDIKKATDQACDKYFIKLVNANLYYE